MALKVKSHLPCLGWRMTCEGRKERHGKLGTSRRERRTHASSAVPVTKAAAAEMSLQRHAVDCDASHWAADHTMSYIHEELVFPTAL
ncbi:Protein PHLOEM protein 2-LIKE [Musa troglodytarum]|uniref:Protein PHLOEM protein 2-LIKE n=1 Tax=Musa troglodytarum TaxID=320322 RepID=A0A9E7JGP8_9LILI|nr:Protein PHLOEM protein 2-LIKE [Musa troglodytarum]